MINVHHYSFEVLTTSKNYFISFINISASSNNSSNRSSSNSGGDRILTF